MKKVFYIILCAFLGLLLSFIAHAIIEIFAIWLLGRDFTTFSLGLSWEQLLFIHLIFTIALSLLGLIFGIWLGFRWWQYIYVDRKYKGRWFKIKE